MSAKGERKSFFFFFNFSPKLQGWFQGPLTFQLNGYWELFFQGMKWPKREADHSSPSIAEVKNERSYTTISPEYLHDVHSDKRTRDCVMEHRLTPQSQDAGDKSRKAIRF